MGKKIIKIVFIGLIIGLVSCSKPLVNQHLTDYVNPFIGTTTLWDSTDLGFQPTRRAWGAEAYPGATLPNSMVQVTPVTQWRSGSGYQYEDTVIYAFAHTSKGHWNLCYAPFIGVSGQVNPSNYSSAYTHEKESAAPGYYQVYLDKYDINAEVTSTLRCAFHKYTFKPG
ncbi:glycoside hydrolase family 92 protein, partial [Marinilabiliaceae bacterium AAT]|nr:glycoside hydrolase family 92 protein [Plebeiobacterium sediminum]